MNAQQLKNSILQMAVQGKLVPQDPNDEPASVLLERIRKEKEKLIKDGKIKKEKNPSYIFRGEDNLPYEKIGKSEPVCIADEVPFEIPEKWEWCRFKQLIYLINGTSYKKNDVQNAGIRILRGGNIQDFKLVLEDSDVFLPLDYCDQEKNVKYGDVILVASTGSKTVIGKPAPITQEYDKVQIGAFLRIARSIDVDLFNWIKLLFQSDHYRSHIRHAVQGTNINNIKAEYIEDLLVPLPPKEEQERIALKYDIVLPLISDYATSENNVKDLNIAFPELLRMSLLQQAVMGKLVPQDPNDEPASILLEKIRAEKAALIKAGKIKKDKHESIIYRKGKSFFEKLDGVENCIDEDLPFDIPESWEWIKIGNIFDVGTGMTPIKSESRYYQNGTIPWINSSLTSNRYIDKVDTFVTDFAMENTSLRLYPEHTLIVAMYGQGKTRGQISELLIPATTNQACAALVSYFFKEEIVNYVYYYFLFNYGKLREKAEGTSQPNLNVQKIKDMIIPFPPLNEQNRIVEMLENILSYCNSLTG